MLERQSRPSAPKRSLVAAGAVGAVGALAIACLFIWLIGGGGGHNRHPIDGGADNGSGSSGGSGGSGGSGSGHAAARAPSATWYCPMTQCGVSGRLQPGKCPKCGMELIQTDANAVPTGPREYAFSGNMRDHARVATAPAERLAFSAVVRLTGQVAVDETLRAVIPARFGGRIERLYVDHLGARVRRGDHMLDIFAPELTVTQTHFLSALRRQRESAERRGGGQAFDNELANARARLLNWGLSARQIEHIETLDHPLETFTLEAPMGGVVVERLVTSGQYVTAGTPLFAVADLSWVWIELAGFESDLASIRFGQAAEVAFPALPGKTLAGVVSFVDPWLDEHTRTVRVRLEIPNPDLLLRPGMLARAAIQVPLTDEGQATAPVPPGDYLCPMHPMIASMDPESCRVCGMDLAPALELGLTRNPPAGKPLVIPATALLSTGTRTLVYVEKAADGQTRYEAREIVPGIRSEGWVVVARGLSPGERVVREGAFQIDSAMQIQGKFSLMNMTEAGSPDPFFGAGSHGGDPEPGWYAAGSPAGWPLREAIPSLDLDGLYAVYLDIGAALAGDGEAQAVRAAHRLLDWPWPSREDGPMAEAEEDAVFGDWLASMRRCAAAMAQATDLPGLRMAFRDGSGLLTQAARRYGAPDGGLRLIFCPMAFEGAGAFWLQRNRVVSNPYHGLEMPRCGFEVEEIR